MRRADRLYRLTDYLRARRRTTAAWLASRLGVSLRTVYRDVADLIRAGVPVVGEAGVGYALARRLDLAPLMFDRDELLALATGVRFVRAYGDETFGVAAERADAKIRGVASRDLVERIDAVAVLVPRRPRRGGATLDALVRAVEARSTLRLTYTDEQARSTEREVWPLGLIFVTASWSLIAWCELRQGFRTFRLDRIRAHHAIGRTFPQVTGRTLADFFEEMQALHGVAASTLRGDD